MTVAVLQQAVRAEQRLSPGLGTVVYCSFRTRLEERAHDRHRRTP